MQVVDLEGVTMIMRSMILQMRMVWREVGMVMSEVLRVLRRPKHHDRDKRHGPDYRKGQSGCRQPIG